MPLYIFKKTIQKYAGGTARRLHKKQHKVKNIDQKTYYTTRYMCGHNKIQKFKKVLCVFCSSKNGQALLGMPDTAVLNILKLNIGLIQVEVMSCKTNREQEAHKVVEGCTNINTVGITKQKANSQNQSNMLINYFYSSKYTEADKRESNAMTQKIHNVYSDIFTGIGCFKGTFFITA